MLIVYSYSLFFSSKNKTLSNSVHLVPQCKERESKEKSKSSSEFRHQRGKSQSHCYKSLSHILHITITDEEKG